MEERWKEWQTNKNPEVLLSFCMRLLFCMHPQFPQVWTAPHSHAAGAPGLWSYCARGFWGYAEYGMSSTLVYCLHANDEWNHPNIFHLHCLIHKTSNLRIQVDYFSYIMHVASCHSEMWRKQSSRLKVEWWNWLLETTQWWVADSQNRLNIARTQDWNLL